MDSAGARSVKQVDRLGLDHDPGYRKISQMNLAGGKLADL